MIGDTAGNGTLEGSAEESLLLQIQALGQLPSPSHTALRLFALLESGDRGIKEIAAVVKSDPTLTARLMRLANRPGNGAVRPAVAVEEALVRLGLNAAVHLAAGLSVLDDALSSSRGAEVQPYLALCHRALAAAVAAEWLCGQPNVPAGSAEMFTCALLARVGQLALLCFYPDAYSGLLETAHGPQELTQLEQNHFGANHVALGSALLNEWGFPTILVEVIRLAESPQDDGLFHERRVIMAQVLRGAWEIAPLLQEEGAENLLGDTLHHTLAVLGVTMSPEGLKAAVQQLRHSWGLWDTDAFHSLRHSGSAPAIAKPDHSDQVTVLVTGISAEALPAWKQNLEAASCRVEQVAGPEQAGRLLATGQAGVAVIRLADAEWEGKSTVLSALVTDRRHAVILLQDTEDEARHDQLLALGADAVFPVGVNVSRLYAQVARSAERVRLYRLLESERGAHRRILSQLAVTTRKLHRQTLTDPLTGLANRRMADAFLKRHWAQAERRQTPLGCLLIDLDDFKAINDTYGHDAGDRVLQELAGILKRQVRQEDLAVRLGGDEFLMVCPLARVSDLEVLRQRLQNAAGKLQLETGPLRFSTGIAERDPHAMKTSEDLLRAADQALIRIKRSR